MDVTHILFDELSTMVILFSEFLKSLILYKLQEGMYNYILHTGMISKHSDMSQFGMYTVYSFWSRLKGQ
jgi:hypothetical protein